MLQRNKPSIVQRLKEVEDEKENEDYKQIRRTIRSPRLLESSGYVILKRIREDKYSQRS